MRQIRGSPPPAERGGVSRPAQRRRPARHTASAVGRVRGPVGAARLGRHQGAAGSALPPFGRRSASGCAPSSSAFVRRRSGGRSAVLSRAGAALSVRSRRRRRSLLGWCVALRAFVVGLRSSGLGRRCGGARLRARGSALPARIP